ncbi:hypothetical protein [Candidatus Profftia lariciata]|nr:hypothetical protein [Candidatus Profftia lariciata]
MYQRPILGLHLMFGLNVTRFTKQIIIYYDGRIPEFYQCFLKQI